MEFKDYYQVLGVEKRAAEDEIRKAFRKLARQHHPDVNPGDASADAKFKELNEAYEVLRNPETRQKYDTLGANWRQYEHAQPGAGPFGPGGPFGAGGWTDGEMRWNVGTGPGGRTMSEEEVRDVFGGGHPFSDFFHTFFGGGAATCGGPSARRQRRGRDVEHPLELSLDEAFRGVTQRLSLQLSTSDRPKTVEVKIPPGVKDGSRVRVAGEGEPGVSRAAAGDLFLRIRLRRHPQFEVKGQDVYVKTEVPLMTAVLGGHAEVPTLDGRPVRLRIPAATQSGQVFRLKGKGMPALRRPTARGDLFATAQVMIPKRLSAEARAHYEALAALESRATDTHTKVEP